MTETYDLTDLDREAELRTEVYTDQDWEDFYNGKPIDNPQAKCKQGRINMAVKLGLTVTKEDILT